MPTSGKLVVVKYNSGTFGSPTWAVVADLDRYDRRDTSSSVTTEVFGNITYTMGGAPTDTVTLSGLNTLLDAGQQAIRAAKRLGTTVDLQILYDGTNGYRQSFNVTGVSEGGQPSAFQTVQFDLGPVGTPTAVLLGPIP